MYSMVCSCESHPLVGSIKFIGKAVAPIPCTPRAPGWLFQLCCFVGNDASLTEIICTISCRSIVAHDNAVLRREDCLPQRFPSPRNKILERKSSQQQREILLTFKLSTGQALKHILAVHETPDSLLMFWFQSCQA